MDKSNEKPMREISVEGCEVLGKGGNGAVYRLDDETIVKVYFSIFALSILNKTE